MYRTVYNYGSSSSRFGVLKADVNPSRKTADLPNCAYVGSSPLLLPFFLSFSPTICLSLSLSIPLSHVPTNTMAINISELTKTHLCTSSVELRPERNTVPEPPLFPLATTPSSLY